MGDDRVTTIVGAIVATVILCTFCLAVGFIVRAWMDITIAMPL